MKMRRGQKIRTNHDMNVAIVILYDSSTEQIPTNTPVIYVKVVLRFGKFFT